MSIQAFLKNYLYKANIQNILTILFYIYDFSKKLYDDLCEIYTYIKGDPNCNINNLLNTTSNN